MARRSGLSARLKLTLSYAGFLMVATTLMLSAAWLASQNMDQMDALQRYLPDWFTSAIGDIVPGSNAWFLRQFAPHAAVAMLLLLVFGLVGGWLLSGHMLAPLTQITSATRLAATGSLSHRIQLDGRQDEFRELADSFDSMLARLETHVAEQRRFAANASHELRTPLAITQTMLDVARRDPDQDPADLVERLSAINARAIELTEALLLLSRTEQRTFEREPVDLSLIAEEAAETLLPMAEKRDITIQTGGDAAPSTGSSALLLQMTTNLLHNAIVHNQPRQGFVQLTTALTAGSAQLVVENSGELLSPELVSTLTEPFRRGTERIRADHAGVGLGLAIVKSIVQAHDGTLEIAARQEGGLRVTVRLPFVAPPRRPSLERPAAVTQRLAPISSTR